MQEMTPMPPTPWAQYKSACGELAPRLARLRDMFAEIAAGGHDAQTASTEAWVKAELDAIRKMLAGSLYTEEV